MKFLSLVLAIIGSMSLSAGPLLAAPQKGSAAQANAGGQLIINNAQLLNKVRNGAEPALPERGLQKPVRSIRLGERQAVVLPPVQTQTAPDGMTFATRLQYVEQLMAQAGFSKFKGSPDVNVLTGVTKPVSMNQMAAVADAYSQTPAPVFSIDDIIRSGAAEPTAPTIGCEAFPYRPTGFMSAANEANRQLLFPYVRKAACDAGIPVGLFDALVVQESRYNALARSHKDAFGLAQLMPGTARQLAVNRYTIHDNLRGGAKLMRELLDKYGEIHLALAAYNAGPGAVKNIMVFRRTVKPKITLLPFSTHGAKCLSIRLWV
ncbi:MAG: lytic transglycosylase domain-containing protein [Sphingomonadales bacterium]|nr:lytic transglycosylase domain-containing protein [Sphingomonadales bacterium]